MSQLPSATLPTTGPAPRAEIDRARRLLLKAGVYVAPAILATALTAENVYASGSGGHGD